MHFLLCSDTTNGCDVNNGGCDQICSIDQNSVMCSCNSGYLLNSDGVSCGGKYAILVKSVKSWHPCYGVVDVNECATANGNCQQICSNTVGSFNCACSQGYVLTNDGVNCMDVNECSSGTHNCQQLCINVEGSFMCNCNDGYVLAVDQRSCNGK